jgi:hypothetical protein
MIITYNKYLPTVFRIIAVTPVDIGGFEADALGDLGLPIIDKMALRVVARFHNL